MTNTAKRRCLIACLALAGWALVSLLIASTLPGRLPAAYLTVAAVLMFVATSSLGRWVDAPDRADRPDPLLDLITRSDAVYLINYADRHHGCRINDPHGAHRFSWRAYVDLPHGGTREAIGSTWCEGWPR